MEIGFKKKTPSFASCVLELLDRRNTSPPISSYSSDDLACQNYGFRPGTSDFGVCRQKIDLARQAAKQQQEQYDEQKRQYDAQIAEYKRKKENASNLAALQCGLNILAGNNCNGSTRGLGPAPIAPTFPNSPSIITLPGNKTMTCNTVGQFTNCY